MEQPLSTIAREAGRAEAIGLIQVRLERMIGELFTRSKIESNEIIKGKLEYALEVLKAAKKNTAISAFNDF